jgi:hypothetical protein
VIDEQHAIAWIKSRPVRPVTVSRASPRRRREPSGSVEALRELERQAQESQAGT